MRIAESIRCGNRRATAFTLIELLVVVAIIVVLIALLMPALASARLQARDVMCASHLRQIGTILNMYAMENSNTFPTPMTHGGSVTFIPVRYYVNGQNVSGSANATKLLDPYFKSDKSLRATMCVSAVLYNIPNSTEQQYWYGTSVWVPKYNQLNASETTVWDPYPALSWCVYPNYSIGKQPHRNFTGMNVLYYGGGVDFVPKYQFRKASFP